MSDARQPFDPSRPNLPETDAVSPTSPNGAEVEGYMVLPCSACGHTHKQSDPKCNQLCGHGSASWSGGLTGGTGTLY